MSEDNEGGFDFESLDPRYVRLYEERVIRPMQGCWRWRGAFHAFGYGQVTVRIAGRPTPMTAPRLAWLLYRGSIPPGKQVLHRCDNPPCSNPAHLYLGTHADNVADRTGRGRSAKGENNGNSRLTAELVRQIRQRYVPRKVTYQQLATELGVHYSLICLVVKNRIWRHV